MTAAGCRTIWRDQHVGFFRGGCCLFLLFWILVSLSGNIDGIVFYFFCYFAAWLTTDAWLNQKLETWPIRHKNSEVVSLMR